MTTREDFLLVADLVDALLQDGEDAPRPTAWSRRWGQVADPDAGAHLLTQVCAGLLVSQAAERGLSPEEAAAEFRTFAETTSD